MQFNKLKAKHYGYDVVCTETDEALTVKLTATQGTMAITWPVLSLEYSEFLAKELINLPETERHRIDELVDKLVNGLHERIVMELITQR